MDISGNQNENDGFDLTCVALIKYVLVVCTSINNRRILILSICMGLYESKDVYNYYENKYIIGIRTYLGNSLL